MTLKSLDTTTVRVVGMKRHWEYMVRTAETGAGLADELNDLEREGFTIWKVLMTESAGEGPFWCVIARKLGEWS